MLNVVTNWSEISFWKFWLLSIFKLFRTLRHRSVYKIRIFWVNSTDISQISVWLVSFLRKFDAHDKIIGISRSTDKILFELNETLLILSQLCCSSWPLRTQSEVKVIDDKLLIWKWVAWARIFVLDMSQYQAFFDPRHSLLLIQLTVLLSKSFNRILRQSPDCPKEMTALWTHFSPRYNYVFYETVRRLSKLLTSLRNLHCDGNWADECHMTSWIYHFSMPCGLRCTFLCQPNITWDLRALPCHVTVNVKLPQILPWVK